VSIKRLGLLSPVALLATAGVAGAATPQICIDAKPPLNPASSVIGTTPAEVQARFAGVIQQNFERGDAALIIERLSPQELTDLATLYGRATSGATAPLLNLLAGKLNARDLQRVAGAFGQNETIEAIDLHTPTSVAQQFFTLPRLPAIRASALTAPAIGVGIATPAGITYTIGEIYLDYRTAPWGSLGVTDALYETAVDVSAAVGFAWEGGQALGTAINSLIETYDLPLYDQISGTVGGMAEQVQDATTEFEQGKYEDSFDSLFGMPLSDSTDGDYDVTLSMAYWYESGGDGQHCTN
jgi:hypothetical protein